MFISANGLCCEIKIHDGTTIAVITLPTPQALDEAHLVALVYRPSALEQKVLARFITLEHSVNLDDGSPPNVLCKWEDSGAHGNMDYGCEPTLEVFFKEVCSLL